MRIRGCWFSGDVYDVIVSHHYGCYLEHFCHALTIRIKIATLRYGFANDKIERVVQNHLNLPVSEANFFYLNFGATNSLGKH